MKRLFKKEEVHPDKRNIYAVTTGDYVGEMFIYIEETNNTYHFLSIPKLINREVPKEKFELAWNFNIIEFVERAPKSVYKVAEKQFLYNKTSIIKQD
jgi:hypothetical protein